MNILREKDFYLFLQEPSASEEDRRHPLPALGWRKINDVEKNSI